MAKPPRLSSMYDMFLCLYILYRTEYELI